MLLMRTIVGSEPGESAAVSGINGGAGGSERTMNRLFNVGINWMQRQSYRTVAETVNDYSSVSCQDVAKLLERFPLDPLSQVTVGPLASWDE